jgi:hypothetical protein
MSVHYGFFFRPAEDVSVAAGPRLTPTPAGRSQDRRCGKAAQDKGHNIANPFEKAAKTRTQKDFADS